MHYLPIKSLQYDALLESVQNASAAPVKPQTSFKEVLTQYLDENATPDWAPTSAAELLSLNAHLNLKVFQAFGSQDIKPPQKIEPVTAIPQFNTPGLQAHSAAIRQAANLDQNEKQALGKDNTALTEYGQDYAFGKVVASTGLSALLMGQGIHKSRSVHSESLGRLLQERESHQPVRGQKAIGRVDNAYSHLSMRQFA